MLIAKSIRNRPLLALAMGVEPRLTTHHESIDIQLNTPFIEEYTSMIVMLLKFEFEIGILKSEFEIGHY